MNAEIGKEADNRQSPEQDNCCVTAYEAGLHVAHEPSRFCHHFANGVQKTIDHADVE